MIIKFLSEGGAARVNTTLADLLNGVNWNQPAGPITLSCTDFTNHMLPVELVDFEAEEKNENVYLNWSTATEINNDYFLIEHSIDGKQFEKIERVDGVGNSVLINHYNFIHKGPVNGVNYYRLRQVDYDGRFEYSDIVSVKLRSENKEVSVYPNFFSESITVKIPLLENNYTSNNERTIKVFGVYNRLVQSHKLPNSDDTIDLNFSELSEGIYFIRADMGNEDFTTLRILKQFH
ncbi:MAG: hypothetical protein ACI9RM_000967 [Ulvibacter sp.]